MTTLEALLITATTLDRIEELLYAPEERDVRQAVHIARLEVENMIETETKNPGRYDGLAD